jgi:CubicO group peptidase (beta-lactamase class C family)
VGAREPPRVPREHLRLPGRRDRAPGERETIDRATVEHSAGPDVVLRRSTRFGLGFQLTRPEAPLGTSPRSFGHFGAGSALGFADPDARLAFAYTMNQPGPRWNDPRNRGLIDALYASL